MGYHVTLSRPDPGSGITAQEWKDFVADRPELELVDADAHFISAMLDGDTQMVLHYSVGAASVFTQNPNGPRIIEYMTSIAPHFGGVVTGDDGETFSTEADWGTLSDWAAQDAASISRLAEARPWWRRELSRGMRVLVGLLLGTLAILIKEVFFSR